MPPPRGGGGGHAGGSWSGGGHSGGNWHGGHAGAAGTAIRAAIGAAATATGAAAIGRIGADRRRPGNRRRIGYWGGYPYYGGYYAAYPYYGYGGYYDAPANVGDSTYSTVDPGTGTRAGQPVPQGTHAPDPIYYPKNGQSAATTESDRRECNRWATTQAGAMNDASIFQRATFACMEGRGYTVR